MTEYLSIINLNVNGLNVVIKKHRIAEYNTYQWNKIENPEINPSLYNQFILDKGGRSITWSKNKLFNNGTSSKQKDSTRLKKTVLT